MSSADPFNTLGGYSVGIPPELVIDNTGNVVNNVNAPNANVTANRIFANSYLYANGQPLSIGASGSNTQVQYNNNGLLGASSAFTFNSATNLLTVTRLNTTTANLGNVANLTILGGNNGYFLQTDGSGNLTWAPSTGNAGNGSPGGANTQVQFNDAGTFGGDAGFTYNKLTNSLVVGNITANYIINNANITANIITANFIHGEGSNITNVSANTANLAFSVAGANVTGQVNFANVANNVAGANVSGQVGFANVANNVAGANVTGQVSNALVAGTVYTAAQPNITSVGTLTSLNVSGNTTLGNSVTSNYFIGNLWGLANTARTVTQAAQPNITSVGTLTTLVVSGNTNLGITNTSNLTATNLTISNNFTAPGNIIAGNVFANTGTVRGNLLQGNLVTAFQPNITTVGNLVSLTVVGNITGANVNGGNLVNANYVTGILTTNNQPNINYVGDLGWLNVNTSVPNSNGNITFNGSLSGTGAESNITITGNIIAGNNITADTFTGELTTAFQPNITSLGNLSSLTVVGETNLGDVSNITILGGNANYVLSTDGLGNLSWVEQSANGSNVVPGGLNTYIQFNDNGNFGGDNTLTWNKNTDTLFVGGNTNISNIVTAKIFSSNVANGTAPLQVLSSTPVANLGAETADTVRNSAQPNITSVGTLTALAVTGNISAANISITNTFTAPNISVTGTIGTSNLTVTNTATLNSNTIIGSAGNLIINGRLNAANSSNVFLGNVSNIKITGGINGYVLSTDGTGNLSWAAGGSGGNGTPGGSNTQVQYNDSGTFGGSAFFTFNEATNNVQVSGNLIANGITLGSGIYQFSYSNVYFATTNSTTPNQVLISIEADNGIGGGNVAAVDYTIISTDDTIRNFIKISCVRMGSSLNYVEYSTLPINGYTGDFQVVYSAGNVIVPSTINLILTPQNANLMTHKMSITAYYD